MFFRVFPMPLAALWWVVVFGCASSSDPAGDFRNPGGGRDLERSSDRVIDLPATSAPPEGRVLLVSVTGLVPDFYVASDGRNALMPTLTELAEDGVWVERLEPAVPASTYPSHATLVTGRYPASHGITGDQLLGDTGVRSTPPWHASRLRGPSLWQAATAADKEVIALGWPTTLGAAISLLVPDVYPTRRGENWIDLVGAGTTPWLLERLRARMPKGAGSDWPDLPERDSLVVDLACDASRLADPPDLWLLRLVAPMGPLWRDGPDTLSMRRSLARVDAELDRLLTCLNQAGILEEMSVVVVGDQAWQPVHTRIEANVALRLAGLIARDPRMDTGVRSWKAIVRSNGGSAFVYAKDEPSALLARDVLEKESKESGVFRVVPASEMSARGADPEAWFGLAARPGYVFGNAVRGSRLLVVSPVRAVGGYFESSPGSEVGLVGWGSGLRRGVTIPVMPAIDLAPTLATLLGISLDETDGRPFVGALSFDPDLEKNLREIPQGQP